MSDTATLPDLDTIDETHTEENAEHQEAGDTRRSGVKRSSSRSAAKPAAKTADKAAAITTETVREVLEVRGALELASAAVICNPGAGEVLVKVIALRAQLAENPFAAAVEILTMDKAERTELWTFAHNRELVEAKRLPANESKAANDLAAALQQMPEHNLDAITGAMALLER